MIYYFKINFISFNKCFEQIRSMFFNLFIKFIYNKLLIKHFLLLIMLRCLTISVIRNLTTLNEIIKLNRKNEVKDLFTPTNIIFGEFWLIAVGGSE